MVDVRNDYPRFQEAGGEVAVVTMGSVEQAAAFRERHKLPFRCLADADQAAYKAFEIDRGGISQIAGPKVWLSGLKSTLKAGVGKPVGDVRQMPGSFIIDSAGIIRFAHYPDNSSEHPSHDEMIRIISSMRTEA